jgi:SNF2 family DNA or RNA helicase
MSTALYKHQSQAFSKLIEYKAGALFMKMGTGKTRVSIELANSVREAIEHVIWVGPLRSIDPLTTAPSIKDEIAKWGGFKAKEVIYIGIETLQDSDRKYLQLFATMRTSLCSFLIVDESIKIKNMDAKRTQRLLELGKMASYRLILNGEPLTKDLLDLYPQINFISPKILNMDLAEFKNTFCNYTRVTKRIGYKSYSREFITGYSNIDYLYSLIGEYVYECDLELEVKQVFETVKFHLTDEEEQEYQLLKTKYLDNEKLLLMNNNIFLELTQKMQHNYCCSPEKFELVREWMEDESKTIIFCKYIASAEACKKAFPKATVLNYKTGSLSLNLQELPYTVYFDQTFDWGDVIQSQHRNYRTGQTQDVRYLKLVGNTGLENMMQENNQKKLGMSEYFKMISKEDLKERL